MKLTTLYYFITEIDARDNVMKTALHVAVENTQCEAIGVLINKCAKTNLETNDNMAPIHLAVDTGNVESLKVTE